MSAGRHLLASILAVGGGGCATTDGGAGHTVPLVYDSAQSDTFCTKPSIADGRHDEYIVSAAPDIAVVGGMVQVDESRMVFYYQRDGKEIRVEYALVHP